MPITNASEAPVALNNDVSAPLKYSTVVATIRSRRREKTRQVANHTSGEDPVGVSVLKWRCNIQYPYPARRSPQRRFLPLRPTPGGLGRTSRYSTRHWPRFGWVIGRRLRCGNSSGFPDGFGLPVRRAGCSSFKFLHVRLAPCIPATCSTCFPDA